MSVNYGWREVPVPPASQQMSSALMAFIADYLDIDWPNLNGHEVTDRDLYPFLCGLAAANRTDSEFVSEVQRFRDALRKAGRLQLVVDR